MKFRPLQINDIILPFSSKLEYDTTENDFLLPKMLSDGAEIYRTRVTYKERNLILKGSFVEDIPFHLAAKKNTERLSTKDFIAALYSLRQKNVDLLCIGIDNRIYRIKVRVGVEMSIPDYFINGVDFQANLVGYETFFEDVTEACYHYYAQSLLYSNNIWRYQDNLKGNDGEILQYPLSVLSPLARDSASINEYCNSTCIWNGSVDEDFVFSLGEEGVNYNLLNYQQDQLNKVISVVVSNSNEYETSNLDYYLPGSSYIFKTSAAVNTHTITLDQAVSLTQYSNGSSFNEENDSFDIYVFCANIQEIQDLSIRLIDGAANYLEMDIVPLLYKNGWNQISLKKSELSETGSPTEVNEILITESHNTQSTIVKINGIFLGKNFAGCVDPMDEDCVFFKNETGVQEINIIGYIEDSNGGLLTVNDNIIKIPDNHHYVYVEKNTIFTGETKQGLKILNGFQTNFFEDVTVSKQITGNHEIYISKINKY